MDRQISPKLLSFNGRVIWRIRKNEEVNGMPFLSYEDLLTGKCTNYRVIGLCSRFGELVAIYWLMDGDDDKMVIIDLKIEGTQRVLSQRIFKLNHFNCTAEWMGPNHRQYSTEVSFFSNVLVGEEVVVLIGSCYSEEDHNNSTPPQQHMVTLPRCPTNALFSEELLLPDIVNLKGTTSGSFFFLARPGMSGLLPDNCIDRLAEMEPRNQLQKIFFLGRLRKSHCYSCGEMSSCDPFYRGYSNSEENGRTPFYGAFPFIYNTQHICLKPFAELQNTTNFPPRPKHNDILTPFLAQQIPQNSKIYFRHTGNTPQLVPALFWTEKEEKSNLKIWHLGCLNLLEKCWSGPMAEWEAPASERAEVVMSADGAMLVLIRQNGNERERMRCFRISQQRLLAPPTLLDLTLISIQCSENRKLKLLAQQLLTSVGK
uniref:Anaphase-promoting complex subunit 1 n=2 Tax=Meloidogyne TaxID=189290 RepID=A0A914L8V7_MELIC